jgi:drug/metabolite transporter (DMT)-like permease
MISDDALGALAACLAAFAVAINDAILKSLMMGELTMPQVLALRSVFVSISFAVTVIIRGECQQPTRALLLRTLSDGTGSALFLTALTYLPQANATAIQQFVPLAVVAASAALGERVGFGGWLCVGAGLLGVIIIVRPGLAGFDEHSLFAAGAVCIMTLRDVLTRRLPSTMPSMLIAFYAALGNGFAGVVLLPTVHWHPLHPQAVGMLAVASCCIICFYLGTVLMMRHGSVAVTQPARYSLLLWASLTGLAAEGDVPDLPALVGGVIIICAGLVSLHLSRVTASPTAGVRPRGGLAASDSAAELAAAESPSGSAGSAPSTEDRQANLAQATTRSSSTSWRNGQ